MGWEIPFWRAMRCAIELAKMMVNLQVDATASLFRATVRSDGGGKRSFDSLPRPFAPIGPSHTEGDTSVLELRGLIVRR